MVKNVGLVRLAAAMVVLAGTAAAQDGTVERTGKRFHIVLRADALDAGLAAKLADEALRTAEGFWPVLERLLPVRSSRPSTITLYHDVAEFRAVERREPRPFQVEGFVTAALEGHVLMWPTFAPEVLHEIGLPRTVVEELRRVAAEQHIAPLVPEWDTTGWVRTVAVMGAVEAASNPRHEPGVDAMHDGRRVGLVGMRLEGNQNSLRSMCAFDMDWKDRRSWDVGHQFCAHVAQLLASESGWAKKLFRRPRDKVTGPDVDRRQAALKAVLGNDWEKVEKRWSSLLQSMQPVWSPNEALWAPGRPRSLLVGPVEGVASVRAVEPPPVGDYVISGRCELGAGPADMEFRVEFGWDRVQDDASIVGVLFEPAGIGINVFSYAKNKWLSMAAGERAAPEKKPFAFRIEITSAEIRVAIDGLPAATWRHGGRETHGVWGFATTNRVVWIDEIRIEPLPAAKK